MLTWSGSEAVLPAYLVGMVLAGTVGKDHELIRRLRLTSNANISTAGASRQPV